MNTTHVLIAIAIVAAVAVAWKFTRDPNAGAEAWAVGRANAQPPADGKTYRWDPKTSDWVAA